MGLDLDYSHHDDATSSGGRLLRDWHHWYLVSGQGIVSAWRRMNAGLGSPETEIAADI